MERMKRMKSFLGITLVFLLVFATTVNTYAASGSVKYKYTGSHVFVLSENDVPLVIGSFGVSVDLGATFFYNSSDTQSRNYNKEEWYFFVDSNNRPTAKSESSCSVGNLIVHPIKASAKTCTKTYTPNILTSPDWVYSYKAGCNKIISVLKNGGNSYAELAYQIAVPKNIYFGASKVVKFNNLGTATGIVTVKSGMTTNKNSEGLPDITVIDEAKPTEDEIQKASKAIKTRMEKRAENEIAIKNNEEHQALSDYAKKNGLFVSDSEVEQIIEKTIELYRNADNMEEVKLACEMAGTTYEEFVRNDFEGYRVLLMEEKVYEDFLKNHCNTSLFYGTMTNEQIETQILAEWESFKKSLISEDR